ncbi:hypothetical protein [Actinoplanes nipponensis]|uniref:hypothetical protein n=1 Tax=Actinoplanes nipponensis TaxID=135950 RepID=UPI0031EBFF54
MTWVFDNIWQLAARDAGFAASRGFTSGTFDFAAVGRGSATQGRTPPATPPTAPGS